MLSEQLAHAAVGIFRFSHPSDSQRRAAAMGTAVASGSTGFIIGPIIGGYLAESHGVEVEWGAHPRVSLPRVVIRSATVMPAMRS
jgi:MFS family permease